MANATIRYDVSCAGWPPEGFFVELDPPLRRFNPEDGTPIDYAQVVVVSKSPTIYGDQAGAEVFPARVVTNVEEESGAESHYAGFVDDSMGPIARLDYGVLHSVIKQMGYDPTN